MRLPERARRDAARPKNFLHRAFTPALVNAGIQDFHWHDLRHTFASRLVMAGVDIRTVQELMGHKTLVMTLRYSRLSPAHKVDAVQRFTRRPTGTEDALEKTAAEAARQVVGLRPQQSEPCWDRTSDPLLKRQLLYH